MKVSKKLLSVLLALAMVCSLAVPAMAAEGDEEAVVVLYTNDVHTYIDQDLTYSKVAALKDTYENVVLVDAGDHIQGTAYGSMDKGVTISDLMNAAGYDLATLGNHEFDYGMDGCMAAVERAQFPYVSCNFYHEKDGVAGDPVLDSYKVFDIGGVKVAFVGITTPESFTKSTPSYFQDEAGNYIYGIAGGTDGAALYAAVQTAIDAAAKEADYVIGLGHLGIDPSSAPWTSEEVITNTTGLDAFIDGHSHSTVEGKEVTDKAGDTVVLTQTGSYLGAVGKMTIAADGTITTELLTAEDLADITPDADVKAIEDAWIAEIDTQLGEVIGRIDDTLDNYDAEGVRLVRKQETNTGDFAADALYYLFDDMDMDVDVAIMNGGGVRNKAITGDISYLTCKDIHTFGNVACLQTVTGQQILDALEWGAKDAAADGSMENGGFLQVSGLKYTINVGVPSTVQKDDKNVWTGGPTGEYRVRDVQVLNKETGEYEALDLTASYNLAGYNYTLRDLGDGFAMFDGAVNVLDYVMEDYMVLANYVQSFDDGLVTGYAEPAGRITIVNEAASLPADVPAGSWYAAAVEYVMDKGYMNGTNVGFEPKTTVTRGTVYQTLYNMAGKPAVEEAASFTDVAGKWYADAAAWAEDMGLTTGTGDGLFSGDRAMTRQELAKAFADYAAAQQILPAAGADLTAYTDAADVSAWAVDGMETAVALSIIKGSDSKLNPKGTALRSELAQMLMNFDALEPTYTETTVTIEVPAQDGIPAHVIDAVVTLPVGEGAFPAVVMLHGTGSNKDEAGMGYAMAAPMMAANGLASIRFDFMGTAADKAEEYQYYNYTSANIDAKAAADYLAGLDEVNGEQIAVMGWSQGGTNALLAAAAYPETFGAVVTWAGALDLSILFEDFDAAYAEAQEKGSVTMTLDWRTPADLPVGAQWFREVKDTDVLAEVAKIKAPILAIHGEADTTVDPASAGKIAEAATNEASDVHMIAECDHTFNVFTGDFSALNDAVSATMAYILDAFAPAQAEQAA